MHSSLKAFSKVIFLPDFLPQKKKAKKGRRDFFPIVGQNTNGLLYVDLDNNSKITSLIYFHIHMKTFFILSAIPTDTFL